MGHKNAPQALALGDGLKLPDELNRERLPMKVRDSYRFFYISNYSIFQNWGLLRS